MLLLEDLVLRASQSSIARLDGLRAELYRHGVRDVLREVSRPNQTMRNMPLVGLVEPVTKIRKRIKICVLQSLSRNAA